MARPINLLTACRDEGEQVKRGTPPPNLPLFLNGKIFNFHRLRLHSAAKRILLFNLQLAPTSPACVFEPGIAVYATDGDESNQYYYK